MRNIWDNLKHTNIHIIGVPEEERAKFGKLFEKIMKEKFPNLVKEIDMQVQETQRIPNIMDVKRPKTRHITIKMTKVKDKDRLLEAAREKWFITYRGIPIGLSADFSKGTLQVKGIGEKYSK